MATTARTTTSSANVKVLWTFVKQFSLRAVSPDFQVWIKKHDPKSAAEAFNLANFFVATQIAPVKERCCFEGCCGGLKANTPSMPGVGNPSGRENQQDCTSLKPRRLFNVDLTTQSNQSISVKTHD